MNFRNEKMNFRNEKKRWRGRGGVFFLAVCLLLSVSVPASAAMGAEDLDESLFSEAQLEPPKAQSFTQTASKKGLQFGESLDDAIDLGIRHCLFNVYITEFMDASGNRLEYDYNGKTYYFNLDAFERWGSLFSQLQDAGINLSVEFLLPWEDGQTDLIYPAVRTPGAHNYYAWNISTREDAQRYAALFSCIAQEFNGKNDLGYIYNYIIGNEVNAYSQWHYTGSDSLEENAKLYADTFAIVYTAVREFNTEARVSICLEHSWNTAIPGHVHSAKSFLDTFAKRLGKFGSPDFAISYHAYAEPLTEADFWNNSEKRVQDSVHSPCITMRNIDQLTKYVKAQYGAKTRIMLTEQGFSSHGANGQMKQAAAIAYAYYKAEYNDMIDCIIFRCQADAPNEIAHDGLYMGLWTEGMGSMKASHDVFKYMDTPEGEAYTQSCRQYLGIQDWSQLIPAYDPKHFAQ